MLRSLRSEPESPEVLFLAATDPANLYGTLLPWPGRESEPSEANETGPADESQNKALDQPVERTAKTGEGSLPAARSLTRTSGAGVILINGNMTAFLRRRSQEVQVFLPEDEPRRSQFGRELGKKLAELAIRRQGRKNRAVDRNY